MVGGVEAREVDAAVIVTAEEPPPMVTAPVDVLKVPEPPDQSFALAPEAVTPPDRTTAAVNVLVPVAKVCAAARRAIVSLLTSGSVCCLE